VNTPELPGLELPSSAPDPLAQAAQRLLHALALLWTPQNRTTLHEATRLLGGPALPAAVIEAALRLLVGAGRVVALTVPPGRYVLADAARTPCYRELLDAHPAPELLEALRACGGLGPGPGFGFVAHRGLAPGRGSLVAMLRLALFSGADEPTIRALKTEIEYGGSWSEALDEAAFRGAFDAALAQRVDPAWQAQLAYLAAMMVCRAWQPRFLPWCEWALQQPAAQQPVHLRYQLAELLIHRGETDAALQRLGDGQGGFAQAMRAAAQLQRGEPAQACAGFAAALKARAAESGARKNLLPETLAWYYTLALLASGGAEQLTLARKFSVAESGSRKLQPVGWGRWAYAIALAQGEVAADARAFELRPYADVGLEALWTQLLRAWLVGQGALPAPVGDALAANRAQAARVAAALDSGALHWLARQLAGASAVLAGDPVPAGCVLAAQARSDWQRVLHALAALDVPEADAAKDEADRRLLWSLHVSPDGRLQAIVPLEQKRGARGWGRPKEVTLSRLAADKTLADRDARVARAIHQDRYHARVFELDRAEAIVALLGHPHLVLGDDAELAVELLSGTPRLEASAQTAADGKFVVLRLHPAPAIDAGAALPPGLADWQRREAEALRGICLEQESARRLRLVRYSAAQLRAARLLQAQPRIPAHAGAELQRALAVLGHHFDVHADVDSDARAVEGESRLRAELSPQGDGLHLRLVVAPLGEAGPRLVPGQGRSRLIAAVDGVSCSTNRDLAAERAHLAQVLDALPELDPSADGMEWDLDEPDAALRAVDVLPGLAAVQALDWPQGKPVRVLRADTPALRVEVRPSRNWLQVDARLPLDEGLVVDLQQLLRAAASTQHFVAIGHGAYLALSQSLRERLRLLAALGDAAGKDAGVRVAPTAAIALLDVVDGTGGDVGAWLRQRVDTLREAMDHSHAPPPTLQAQLRGYQEAGYNWAMRLARAGFGACLADDMGLGKTLQALAVLCARAAGGAALVVAPTSVCGNWLAECRRFAPALNARIVAEPGRDAALSEAGAGDLVIVSYTLLQQHAPAFAARAWHTVVADEAQAVKNALAKRSQALFELRADFRLALSGTPVENRLSELWSVMHFCNPGLLGPLTRFQTRFANPIERERQAGAQRTLHRLIAPFLLRRIKAEVLDDLPERTELTLSVQPDAAELAHYEALRRNLVDEIESAAHAQAPQARLHILAQLTKLRRAACDPRLVTPGFAPGAKVRAFAELVGDIVANRHRVLVFSQFVDFLGLLRVELDAAGVDYQYLDGATPAAERTRRVQAFQGGDGAAFLISLKAGGFGLNLTAADYVVIMDPWWNPAAEEQAMGRAHRIGQQRPVTVYRLVNRGTLEERIVELHRDKRALADSVLAEQQGEAALPSTQDLLELLRDAPLAGMDIGSASHRRTPAAC
jgi:superfamily II DNA or RNA helicase